MLRKSIYRLFPRRCLCQRQLHSAHDKGVEAEPKRNTALHSNKAWIKQSSKDGWGRLETLQRPSVNSPDSVLIEVKAASVNPIDIRMADGYGHTMLDLYSRVHLASGGNTAAFCGSEKGVQVLGRDFSGVVTQVGQSVTKFKPGDQVYGALKAIDEGTHIQYTQVPQNSIALKPANLTHIEAASIPYVALTFISAVDPVGSYDFRNKSVFINGGAGGIGTFAVQYLKSKGCEVTVAVGEGRDVVESLNADYVLDYRSDNFQSELRKLAGFDLAFDCVGDESALSCVKPGGKFVTVVSPLLPDTDDLGLVMGGAKATLGLAQKVSKVLFDHGVYYSWGFFMPNSTVLEEIRVLTESNQIKPVVGDVYPFNDVPSAYQQVSQTHGRGKVVIDMSVGD